MMKSVYRYLLAFGSNLGEREQNCRLGLQELLAVGEPRGMSEWIYTKPLLSPCYDTTSHANYLNFVLDFASSRSPAELYQDIVRIEDKLGHARHAKWLPRHLDIDILLWAKDTHPCFRFCHQLTYSDLSGLCIPHRELFQREFLVKLLFAHFAVTSSSSTKDVCQNNQLSC